MQIEKYEPEMKALPLFDPLKFSIDQKNWFYSKH